MSAELSTSLRARAVLRHPTRIDNGSAPTVKSLQPSAPKTDAISDKSAESGAAGFLTVQRRITDFRGNFLDTACKVTYTLYLTFFMLHKVFRETACV